MSNIERCRRLCRERRAALVAALEQGRGALQSAGRQALEAEERLRAVLELERDRSDLAESRRWSEWAAIAADHGWRHSGLLAYRDEQRRATSGEVCRHDA
ncbi:hypothetical protein D9M70_370310 [compost metagenome]